MDGAYPWTWWCSFDFMDTVERQIPSFPGYVACENGDVWSLNFKGHPGVRHKMQPSKNEKGYMCVTVHKDGKMYRKRVHRLVWEAFNGPIPQGLEINHKDEDRTNNNLGNLELLSHRDNLAYGHRKEKHANAIRGRKRVTTPGCTTYMR